MITRLFRVASIAAAAVMLAGVGLGCAQFGASRTSSLDVSTLTLGLAADPVATSSDGCVNVTIAWTRASGADTYGIEVQRDLAGWTMLVTDAGDVTSVDDATSAGASEVQYRITSRHAASGWTGPSSTTTTLTCL